MKILALETASDACSAALFSDNEIYQEYQVAPRAHTRLLLPMLEKVLAEGQTSLQQIDAIAFSRGPGAFTGLRIAAGVTQGIAFSADKPVIAISTLAALAQQALINQLDTEETQTTVLAGLDARMQEVYWGEYQRQFDGELKLIGNELVIKPEAISLSQPQKAIAIGSAWQVYGKQLQQRLSTIKLDIIDNAYPQAQHIAQLAVNAFNHKKLLTAEQAQPIYLRNNVAQKCKQSYR